MRTAIIRRCLQAIPTLLLVSVVVFAVIRLIPGDPAAVLAGPDASPAVISGVRSRLGLDKPIVTQYWRWLIGVLHGDFGNSLSTQQGVLDEIAPRLLTTTNLVVWSMLVSVVIGVPLGILSAYGKSRIADKTLNGTAMLMIGVPTYWVGLMGILIFAVTLKIFPAGGIGGVSSWVLPVAVLALPEIGMLVRLVRSSFIGILDKDYIRHARQKGLREIRIMWRHALPNGGITILSFVGVQFAHLLAGAVVVEVVFAIPGIGRLSVDALLSEDLPTVQGTILVFALAVVVVNLLTDLAYLAIDPRLDRQGA